MCCPSSPPLFEILFFHAQIYLWFVLQCGPTGIAVGWAGGWVGINTVEVLDGRGMPGEAGVRQGGPLLGVGRAWLGGSSLYLQ